ncbi:MAG: Glu/Leu/Phe/Val dehydrogenase, partial [Rhodospirillales bacterium]|nr:Glu/Leu/Phe/Val dehydrogenase [Rhodospirillales bacterium]
MDEIFRFSDPYGPKMIVAVHDQKVGLKGVVVVDNVARGPAIGGTRMAPDVSVEECFRLARAMTFKNAAANLPHGGAKSVIVANPQMSMDEKERLFRAFARAIKDITDYIPGPDMGTNETCMAWIKDEIGRAVGLPEADDGIPLDEIGATGLGLVAAIDVAKNYCDLDLKGATVAIQGFGSVGFHTARFLKEKGAVLVGVCDLGGTVVDPDGLDLDRLLTLQADGKSVIEYGGKVDNKDAIIDVPCDIWVPAARPDVITKDNVERLKTRLIPQGANIPMSIEIEKQLHDQGVLILPDFIANA